MVSTMNEGSNGEDDLFLEDDLNDIFVEGDESNGNILDFSHSTVGSLQEEFLRRRSSTVGKATIESNMSRQSSIDDDDRLRSMTSDINPMTQQRNKQFQSVTTGTTDCLKKRSSINKVGVSSEIGTNKSENGKTKSKQGKTGNTQQNKRERQRRKDDDVDDNDEFVGDFTDDGNAESNDVEILSDEEENEDVGMLHENSKEASTCRQLGMNDDSARELDQLDVLPTDVFGKGGQQAWHSEGNDKEHRKQMILEIARILQIRKKVVPSQEWLHQLPHKARQLEGRLYGAASSLQSYLDRSTLKNRLRIIANRITMQFIDHSTHGSDTRSSRRVSLSKLAQDQERRQSSFEPRQSIFSNASSIDTTASLNVALRNKAAFLDDGARHDRNVSQSGSSQQKLSGSQDTHSYNTEQGNHPSGHPSVIIVNRNATKSSPLMHSVDGSDSVSGSHERKQSGNGSLAIRRMPQDAPANDPDDNMNTLTSLQQQLLLQLKQQPQNMGQYSSTKDVQPLGIIGRKSATSVGMNSATDLLNQAKPYDRAQHSLASKTELERQKVVNAKLQEQIVANIRMREDMVRRLQSNGQTVPLQQQQQLAEQEQQQLAELQRQQMRANSIHSPTTASLLQQMGNPTMMSNSNIQMNNSPAGSSSQHSSNFSSQQMQNSLLMQNKLLNAGGMSFSAETVMSNDISSQSQQMRNSTMMGGPMGMGNGNNNSQMSSLFNMNQMSQMESNSNHLNRNLQGVQGLNNNSFHGVASLQGNVASNGMQRSNPQLSDMSALLAQGSNNSSNQTSMDFQALYNAQQRALGQQIGNSNSNAMFGNDVALQQQQQQQQQQLQQLQLLRGLGNRNSSGVTFNNNNLANRNMSTQMQAAFQQQQQQLFHGSNLNMPMSNAGNNSMQHSEHGMNPMMGMGVTTGNGSMGFMGMGLGGMTQNNNSTNSMQQHMENGLMNTMVNQRNSFSNMQNINININTVSNDDSNNIHEPGVAPLSPRSFAW